MDHVIDSTAVRCALVRGANEDEFLVAGHLRAGLRGADAEELHDEKVKFEDELADVLVLPHALVNLVWQFANFDHVSGFIADKFL